jgi:hypothetical protein
MRGRRRGAPTVAIVSTNADTRDGLESYLRGAGVVARSLRDTDELTRVIHGKLDALVLFPDDFRWESVIATVADLAERWPNALPVLVTAHPKRFENLAGANGFIVPRPAWGWRILDAIRAHVDTDRPKTEDGEAS